MEILSLSNKPVRQKRSMQVYHYLPPDKLTDNDWIYHHELIFFRPNNKLHREFCQNIGCDGNSFDRSVQF